MYTKTLFFDFLYYIFLYKESPRILTAITIRNFPNPDIVYSRPLIQIIYLLLNCLLFITVHDESLSNHICCQFDVIWLFLLSDERVHKPFLKYIHCCSQMFKCFLFFFLCRFCIDIHSGLNILMPHDRLDYFQVRFSFTKPCAKCLSQAVR